MADRDDFYDHYDVDGDTVNIFNDKLDAGDPTSWRAHRRQGHALAWVFAEVIVGGRAEKRMFPCWHDADGAPIAQPTRFPALDVQAPAGPIKDFWVTMSSVLRFIEGDMGRAAQKVVFDHESTDPRFADWAAFCADMHRLLNVDRCTFLAKHADDVAGSYLSKQEHKYIKKHGDTKGAEWLLEHLEDPNNRSQHLCRYWSPKATILQKRKIDGAMLKVCPADELILTPEFDPSGAIRGHIEDSKDHLSLKLLPITLPDGASKVLPAELERLRPNGAIGSLRLTLFSLYKRPQDDQHSMSCAATGITLLTNGQPKTNDGPAIDMMASLRASKRPRVDSA